MEKPSPQFSHIIKRYWSLQTLNSSEHTQRIFPTGLPEIHFYFSSKPSSSHRNISDHGFINSQQTSYFDINLPHSINLFSVTLQPNVLSIFSKIQSSYDYKNQTISLQEIDPIGSKELYEKLANSIEFRD